MAAIPNYPHVYQGTWSPGTNDYVFGRNSIDMIQITGGPADANYRRWSMFHGDGVYRLLVFKGNSRDTLYQFTWNGTTYNHGSSGAQQVLTINNVPEDADASSFATLHTPAGPQYGSSSAARLYMHRLGDPETLYQFSKLPGNDYFDLGPSPLETISVVGFPLLADWSRWMMLFDGVRYRIYAFHYDHKNRIYQGAFNPSTQRYEYGFNSINWLDLVSFPGASNLGRAAMLHDGSEYRFYFQGVFV